MEVYVMSRENIKFGGDPVTIVGEEIKVGDKAPAFKATNTDLSPFNSEDYKGKVKIYSVVPSIDTGVCQIQTRTFNEEAADLGDDIVVITVSKDLPFAQDRFCAVEGIDRAMIVSDYKDGEFGKKYGFLIDELGLLTRGVIVVDKDETVKYVEYVQEVTNEPDYDKAIEEAKKLV